MTSPNEENRATGGMEPENPFLPQEEYADDDAFSDEQQALYSGSFLSDLRNTENRLPQAEKTALFADQETAMNVQTQEPISEADPFTENTPVKKKRKKVGMKGLVAVLCALCAIIGGISGGLSVAVYDRFRLTAAGGDTVDTTEENSQNETLPPEETLAGHIDQTTPASEGPTTPEVTTPMALSAKEIYANSVNTVVGIGGNVTIDNGIWGKSNAQIAGSGFIISENGYIVTNAHVVTDVKNLTVTLFDDKTYPATLVGTEKSNDIAVIKIEASGLQAAPWGNSGDLSVGDSLLVIGNPLGELTHTLTTGVVSALSRQIESESDVINMFQTNAAINSGNSGCPVFDMNGQVVGIATSKYASESIEGLSFCIPSNDVKGYIDDIIAYGYAKNRPLLGVSVQTVTNSIASRYKIVLGAYVVELGANEAAAKAGMQKGDVIVEINNRAVSAVADLQSALHERKAGDSVNVIVYRNGQRINLTITLDEKKPASARTTYTNVYDL